MTPEARRDRAAILRHGGVAPAHPSVLAASPFLLWPHASGHFSIGLSTPAAKADPKDPPIAPSWLFFQSRLPRERFLANTPSAIPGEYVFVHKINRAMVEIHTESTLRHFPVPPDLEQMSSRSIIISVDGREVPAFGPEDELLMLAVHGAKDFWARLVWVADVAEIVKQSANLDWESLLAAANKIKVTRMLNLALSLAHEIVGLEMPSEIASRIQADVVVKRLTRQLCGCLLKSEPLPGGLFSRSLYRIRMTEGLWDGLRYWGRLMIAPAEEDWAMAELPSDLSKSYAVLRPFRLWRKYGRRTPHKR